MFGHQLPLPPHSVVQFIFWQNIISPHQAGFIRSLAELGHDVSLVAAVDMTADRVANGWTAPELPGVRVITDPKAESILQTIDHSAFDAVHVLAGARLLPMGKQITQQCIRTGRRTGILTEAPDPRGILGCVRWLKYAAERWRWGGSYDFVLAMGEIGTHWFRRCGYPAAKVFPFAYSTDSPPNRQHRIHASQTAFNILYVGRLVGLKGVEDLLRAFQTLSGLPVTLSLVGDGPLKPKLKRLAESLPNSSQITWLGALDNVNARTAMSQADLLVLPSHKDGWGAVVNEALMEGTPVVCSDACGAADLIRNPLLGAVFPAGNVPALASAMRTRVSQGRLFDSDRLRLREWAHCISGSRLAEYLGCVMNHLYCGAPRPEAPWRL